MPLGGAEAGQGGGDGEADDHRAPDMAEPDARVWDGAERAGPLAAVALVAPLAVAGDEPSKDEEAIPAVSRETDEGEPPVVPHRPSFVTGTSGLVDRQGEIGALWTTPSCGRSKPLVTPSMWRPT